MTRVTFQLVAREEFFDDPSGAALAAELGDRILLAEVR
jgi:hypothetical protein